jgi:hypothetical protein
MTTHTAMTTRTGWCPQCHGNTPHVFASLREGGTEYRTDQCLECGRWAA